MKRYLDQTPAIKAARIAKTLAEVGRQADADYIPDHVIQRCIKPSPPYAMASSSNVSITRCFNKYLKFFVAICADNDRVMNVAQVNFQKQTH